MAPPPATMVSRPPINDHNSYISFRDFVPDEDAANLTREQQSTPSIDAGNPNAGKLWLGLEDQTAFIMAQREALEAFNVAKALRQSEESARADEARRARAAVADKAENTFATKVVVEEEEPNGSCTQSQALAIRAMTPAPRTASRASASASAAADEAARSLARSRQIDPMQYPLLEKVSSGSLGSSYNPSTSPSGYTYIPSSSPSASYSISESPTRTRYTSASASAAAHAQELSRKATAFATVPAPGSASAAAASIRRPSSSASQQAQAHARRPSLTTTASSPVVTALPASAPIPVPNAYRSQTPGSLTYQQSQYFRQSQVYYEQQQAYQRSRLNSQSQPSSQNRPQSPPQPQQPYQQFIPQHARVASNSSNSIRSSTPLSSSYPSSSASAFASSSATSYPSRTTATPAPVASSSSSSPPKFNVPSQPPAGHSSASASAAGYTRARGLSRSETPSQRPTTPMAPVVAYAPSTSPTAYTTAAAVGASEKRRKSSVSQTPQIAPSGQPYAQPPPPSATPMPPSSLPRDGISIGARLARPSTSLGHGLLQHQRTPSQSEPPVAVPSLPRSMTPSTHQSYSAHRDRQEARDAREARERQLAKEEAREAGADLFTPTRPCRGCGRPVASPRSQGSPDVDLPTPFADLLHVTCGVCRTTHCRGCFTVARCPPGCNGGDGCLVANCCASVRAVAIFEALAAFDSVYISETTYFASVSSSSASQNARDGETSKKSHSSVGKVQRQVYLRALIAKPKTGRFTTALVRTLKVLHDRLVPATSSSSSDAGTAAETSPANLTPFIQRVLACSLLPEVLHAFLVDAPVRDWIPHSEACCAMLDALSRLSEACPSIIEQRMRPIERSPGVGRVVWARGRLTWASTSSSEQAAGHVTGNGSGEVRLKDLIRGLEDRAKALRALAGSMHYQETIYKVNALCDRMSYLGLQQLLGNI
ncbi:hypothetical protein D9619_002462 [Psilocybe cf. subviscida]|uniref:Uncharacterized protein n=1 Tax=Psilocybe cf. subviscida TaxID=2480587 RepID=A0A8H5EU36_9AGAR|nr:hypothetical protein D9619_002462 [Psilocybe cf. subviscida]